MPGELPTNDMYLVRCRLTLEQYRAAQKEGMQLEMLDEQVEQEKEECLG
jgi:hypothetical protein